MDYLGCVVEDGNLIDRMVQVKRGSGISPVMPPPLVSDLLIIIATLQIIIVLRNFSHRFFRLTKPENLSIGILLIL